MPIYTYRREDGSTFEVRQSFNDEPLKVDPETGQKVARMIHAAGVIFKGSGFYVNDSKSTSSTMSKSKSNGDSEHKSEVKSETSEAKSEKKEAAAETKKEPETKKTENKASVTAAAD